MYIELIVQLLAWSGGLCVSVTKRAMPAEVWASVKDLEAGQVMGRGG